MMKTSAKQTHVLIVEHSQSDVDLILYELNKSNLNYVSRVVHTEDSYIQELAEFKPSVILSDYTFPSFDGERAFILKQQLSPGTPFIFVSGTIGEEKAVQLIRNGVSDYALKDTLYTLPAKIFRALQESEDQKEKTRSAEKREFDKNNLSALINNTVDLLWSVDLDFQLITSNKSFDEMSVISFGHVVQKGDNILEVSFSPEMYTWFESLYQRAFKGETFSEISHFDHPAELWTEISFAPIRKGLKIIGAACHSRDITQSKLSERNLQRSESRLKEAQAISHIGNWEYDLQTYSHFWSDELYSIFRTTPENIVPSTESFLSFIHPEDVQSIKEEVEQSLLSHTATSYNFRFIRADGELRYGHTERKFDFNSDGKAIRLLGVLHDITDRKVKEEEREKMIASLVQHTKNLEQFTAIISHNLRSPVAHILGLSNVLKTAISEEDRNKTQQYLINAAAQLDDMLKDLNVILQAKAEINEYKEKVDLGELTEAIKSSIQTVLDYKNVQLITDFSQQESIFAIRSYLYSIFYNLITNSIKYMQRGVPPIISISCESRESIVRIVFRDNGIGIDLYKHSSNIFGLYKRFHDHTEGKGLGLFIVKTQIEALGGTIQVESKVDSGTQFTIELPT
jgi:PAS domain S-box-containing protein